MTALIWGLSLALAGEVRVNDTVVDPASLAGVTLERATVTFDDAGNIQISAPGTRIELVEPPGNPVADAKAGDAGVVEGRWWLVTEDDSTVGHKIEVSLNGQLAYTVRSGERQRIEDIGDWLIKGDNEVRVRATSHEAGGGQFFVFLGTGSDVEGTVVMDNPVIQFGVGANAQPHREKTYTLNVDR